MIHLRDVCDTCHGKGYTRGEEAPARCPRGATWGPRNEFGRHWTKEGTCLSRSSYHVYLKQGKGPRRKVYVRRGTCLGWHGPDFTKCRYPPRQWGGLWVVTCQPVTLKPLLAGLDFSRDEYENCALCQLGFTCDRHDRFFACEYNAPLP